MHPAIAPATGCIRRENCRGQSSALLPGTGQRYAESDKHGSPQPPDPASATLRCQPQACPSGPQGVDGMDQQHQYAVTRHQQAELPAVISRRINELRQDRQEKK